MAVRKRGNSWQMDVLIPTGKLDEDGKEIKERYRRTYKTRKEALGEHDKIKTLVREKRFLEVKKEYKTTFGELTARYEENHRSQPSFAKYKGFCVGNFKAHFGEKTLLSAIRYLELESYRNGLREKLTKNKTERTDASVNREMACLRHMFTKAKEWDMVEENPFKAGRSLILKENNRRVRYLTEEEVQRLLAECRSQKHLYRAVVAALNTGMRRGEILSLKWNQIRNSFIYVEKSKTKERREIPINETLLALLKEIRKAQGLSSPFVFNYRGDFIKRIDRAFSGAVKRAGIEDFRFHDLRHTFASHLVMRGASLKDVQEILGHKTMTMTLRYAHLSAESKKKAVNLLSGLTASSSMSQNVTNCLPIETPVSAKCLISVVPPA